MPKLDTTRLIAAKMAGGTALSFKGQGFTWTKPQYGLNLTSANGLYQDTAGTNPVTAYGQNVRRIVHNNLSATWVSGTATWQAGGLVVGGGAQWNLDTARAVAGLVVACTPSVGDTSNNHGIIGSASEYVTVADGIYRWRTAADSATWGVPDATLAMQVASFEITGTSAAYWTNGVQIPNDTQSGKAALTAIDRLFHRSTTVSYEGTLAYIAMSATPHSNADREMLQREASEAAKASWALAGRTLFTPRGIPLITEILGSVNPSNPVLVSHHGLSGKADGNVYNASNWATAHGMAFSPWFDQKFSSNAYQKGEYSWLEAPMVAAFRSHIGQPSKPVFIYGHSAGAQWVSRVAAYNPVSNVQRYVVANPSTWVFPDDRAQPFGFGHLASGSVRNAAIAAYLALPLTVYIGSADNDPNDPDLDTSSDAMAQGAHRLERAQNVYAAAQSAATSLSVPLNWTYVVANGVGHAGTSMLNAAERNQAFEI